MQPTTYSTVDDIWLNPEALNFEHRRGLAPLSLAATNLERLAGPIAMDIITTYTNAYIAGGIVEKALNVCPSLLEGFSDVDIFITGDDETQMRTFRDIIMSLPDRPYFSFRRGAVDVFYPGQRIIQIVVLCDCQTIAEVIISFDVAHIQVAYGASGFTGTVAAWGAIYTGITTACNLRVTDKRILKSLMNGYRVVNSPWVTDSTRARVLDIIVNPSKYPSLYAYSFTAFQLQDHGLPEDMERIYALTAIKQQTPPQNIVTESREVVATTFQPGTKFRSSHSSLAERASGSQPENASSAPQPSRSKSRGASSSDSSGDATAANSREASEPRLDGCATATDSPVAATVESPVTALAIDHHFNPKASKRFDVSGKVKPLGCGCEDYASCQHKKKKAEPSTHRPKSTTTSIPEPSTHRPKSTTTSIPAPAIPAEFTVSRVVGAACSTCGLYGLGDCMQCSLVEIMRLRRARLAKK